MNPYLSVILTIAICFLIFALWIIYENYKSKKRILNKIRRNWGKPYTRQYEPGDIEQISHYFRRFFSKHEKEREHMQLLLLQIGKTKFYSETH